MRRFLLSCGLLSLVLALGSAPQVRADVMDNFEYTETISGDLYDLVWQLPASPTPDDFLSGDAFVVVTGVTSTLFINGISQGTNPDEFFFANSNSPTFPFLAGGFASLSNLLGGFNLTSGSQLYTGDESAPTFTTGKYAIGDIFTDNEGTLVISATPEPSSLLFTAAGLAGLLALAARKRAAA